MTTQQISEISIPLTTRDSTTSEIVSTQDTDTMESHAHPHTDVKRRRSKRKRTLVDAINQVLLQSHLYDNYEEDDEKAVDENPDNEPFPKKIQRLKELIALQPALKKSKEKMDKEGAGLSEEIMQMIENLRNEIEMEEFNTEKRIAIENKQKIIRKVQLERSMCVIATRTKSYMNYVFEWWELKEWLCYISCNGLPDPTNLQDLNRFLFTEKLADNKITMNTLSVQCIHMITLIEMLNEIIDYPLKYSSPCIEMYKEVRQKYRNSLQLWIDLASYNLLRQIDKDTERVDLRNARYVKELTSLICCFWALIKQPISMKVLADKDKKAVEVEYEEINLTIKMPLDVDCYASAIRALWIDYDYYSDRATTFFKPELPEKYVMNMDLLNFCNTELIWLTKMREEQMDSREIRLQEKRAMIESLLKPPEEAKGKDKKKKGKGAQKERHSVTQPKVDINLINPEDTVIMHEEEARKEKKRLLFIRCKKTEVNLRKYMILGGIFQIDIISQPPQPKDFLRPIFLTTLNLPKELEFVKFSRPYKAPPPTHDSGRTPEKIEAEIKALELAMEALALVTLKLPKKVLWFEPPLVAHWIEDEKIWSTEDVHDIKYNEEKKTITFRTGRLGIHGLAGYRFVNLPFQSWELKPESNKTGGNGVILSITGAIIQLEFLVREDLISLHSIVGGGTTLEPLIGDFMKLEALIKKLRSSGCDVFPEEDTASYLKGLVVKHPIAVRHLHSCMGLLSTSYSFSWSRWNSTRGHREIVLQIKELHGAVAKGKSNAILLVTPFQTSIVRCSEIGSEFSIEPADEKDRYYADLCNYALHNAGIKSLQIIKSISFALSTTISKLLEATNVINMSA